MTLKFTGRESQLNEVAQLIKAKQGAVFAVSANAGMGKSTLLRQIAKLYPKKGQVFYDLDYIKPLQTAAEFLCFSIIIKFILKCRNHYIII
jgi:ABC-type cobalamin/Fe3+-siderophores transport system ATPase subunit